MKKICLAGLISFENYGDQFIAKSVEYLVKKVEKVSICYLDFFHVYDIDIHSIGARIPTKLGGRKITEYELLRYQKKLYKEKLIELRPDGIIFACGSYKYSTQDLYRNYSAIVWAAKEINIPIMFDAMNIQKYSDDDVRCKILKKYSNFSNVKMITSRDGLMGVNRLKQYYIHNKQIKLLPVGDPALWIPECYSILKNKSNIVGINIIRKDIFLDYGYDFSCNNVIDLYVKIMRIFDNNNIKYRLFTNGLKVDYDTALEVLRKYNEDRSGDLSTNIIIHPKNDVENIEMISNFSTIIGARLHANICAYSLDIPLVSFIWDEKMKNFAISNSLEDYFLDIDNLTAKKLVNVLNKVIYSSYDKDLRENWKSKTLDSIREFISEI